MVSFLSHAISQCPVLLHISRKLLLHIPKAIGSVASVNNLHSGSLHVISAMVISPVPLAKICLHFPLENTKC